VGDARLEEGRIISGAQSPSAIREFFLRGERMGRHQLGARALT